MSVSLKGKNVLVIGASSGIGRASAILFAKQGSRVVAAARRQDRLQTLKEELQASGCTIYVKVADASIPSEMEELAKYAIAEMGSIDFLVFATGTNTPDRAMSRLTPDIWNMMINVNLNAAYYATSAVLPAMRKAGSGYLIYISSISGLVPDVSGAAYQAAKRGLVGLAHAIRVEEKENGIRTCVVCPGLVETEILEKRPVKPSVETLRLALQPEDVADVVLAVATLPERAVVPEVQILPTRL